LLQIAATLDTAVSSLVTRQVGRSVCVVRHDPSPTQISTLSLHDALPIYFNRNHNWFDNLSWNRGRHTFKIGFQYHWYQKSENAGDRKSTRLNSSHQIISYAVFCLKKKTD